MQTREEAIQYLRDAGFERVQTRDWAMGKTIQILMDKQFEYPGGIIGYKHMAYITINDPNDCSVLADRLIPILKTLDTLHVGPLKDACDKVIELYKEYTNVDKV